MKICSACKTEKTETEFGVCRSNPDGLNYVCKACLRKRSAKYRASNAEAIRRYQAKYRAEHKDRIALQSKMWSACHRDRINNQKKQRRKLNPEQFRAEHKAAKHRRRARIKEQGGSYTPSQLQTCLRYFDYCCAYSGDPLEPEYHIDHVVALSQGGSNDINNIVPSNRNPNISKGVRAWRDWYKTSEWYDPTREEKIDRWIKLAQDLTQGVG